MIFKNNINYYYNRINNCNNNNEMLLIFQSFNKKLKIQRKKMNRKILKFQNWKIKLLSKIR